MEELAVSGSLYVVGDRPRQNRVRHAWLVKSVGTQVSLAQSQSG